jgi:hypothetical protein
MLTAEFDRRNLAWAQHAGSAQRPGRHRQRRFDVPKETSYSCRLNPNNTLHSLYRPYRLPVHFRTRHSYPALSKNRIRTRRYGQVCSIMKFLQATLHRRRAVSPPFS